MKQNLNPFSSEGRITRGPFILFSIGYFLLYLPIHALGETLGGRTPGSETLGIYLILLMCFLVPTFFLWIKRLRDIHKSPYMSLLMLVPLVGLCCWIYLATAKSKYE